MSDQTKQQDSRSVPATFAKNEFEKDAFILKQLVTKDFKIKYRRSVLGQVSSGQAYVCSI